MAPARTILGAGAAKARNAPTTMTDDPDSIRTASPEIVVEVRTSSPLWQAHLPEAPALVERAARAALACAGPGRTGASATLETSFLLADDAQLRRLNRDFRNRDKPTNVLSFPAEDDGLAAPGEVDDTGPRLLGDVALAFETIEREAAAQSKPLANHLSHLAVHGVLHLLGHDHAAPREATRMERLEAEVLASIGIADPYAPAGCSEEAVS